MRDRSRLRRLGLDRVLYVVDDHCVFRKRCDLGFLRVLYLAHYACCRLVIVQQSMAAMAASKHLKHLPNSAR